MIANLPSLDVLRDRLLEDIAAVLDRRAEWPEWSAKSRRFVETGHNSATTNIYRNPAKPYAAVRRDERDHDLAIR
jgi:hypothetical protein